MAINTVQDEMRHGIIRAACDRNLPVEVVVLGETPVGGLKSRMLKAERIGTAGRVLIAQPGFEGRSVSLRRGVRLEVLLLLEAQRYLFQSPIVGSDSVKLSGDVSNAALILSYPDEVVRAQRRRFFRVRVPTAAPLVVSCAAKSAKKQQEGGDDVVRFEGRAFDISPGGLCLAVSRTGAALAQPGAPWVTTFTLPESIEPMRLLGQVRNVRRTSKGGLVGLQFTKWDKSLAGRKAIHAIARYVAARQREELKKLSGLD